MDVLLENVPHLVPREETTKAWYQPREQEQELWEKLHGNGGGELLVLCRLGWYESVIGKGEFNLIGLFTVRSRNFSTSLSVFGLPVASIADYSCTMFSALMYFHHKVARACPHRLLCFEPGLHLQCVRRRRLHSKRSKSKKSFRPSLKPSLRAAWRRTSVL